jgi:hypothetical protein
MNVATEAPAGRRLAVRFSLRLLLVAVAAAAAGLGFWKAWVHPYRVQREAIQVFQDAGATVAVRPGGPEWLRRIAGDEHFQTIVHVDLSNCPVTDECLDWLRRLPDLETFHVGTSTFGVPIPTIERTLENAEYLNLSRTPVTDQGLRHLAGCSNLKTLFLRKTRVTDAGLRRLHRMSSLHVIWLTGTEVTPDGVRELRAALPHAYVGY